MNKMHLIIKGLASAVLLLLVSIAAFVVSPLMMELSLNMHPFASGVLVFVFMLVVTLFGNVIFFGLPLFLLIQGDKVSARILLVSTAISFVLLALTVVFLGRNFAI